MIKTRRDIKIHCVSETESSPEVERRISQTGDSNDSTSLRFHLTSFGELLAVYPELNQLRLSAINEVRVTQDRFLSSSLVVCSVMLGSGTISCGVSTSLTNAIHRWT